jgi:hypothetical protein
LPELEAQPKLTLFLRKNGWGVPQKTAVSDHLAMLRSPSSSRAAFASSLHVSLAFAPLKPLMKSGPISHLGRRFAEFEYCLLVFSRGMILRRYRWKPKLPFCLDHDREPSA